MTCGIAVIIILQISYKINPLFKDITKLIFLENMINRGFSGFWKALEFCLDFAVTPHYWKEERCLQGYWIQNSPSAGFWDHSWIRRKTREIHKSTNTEIEQSSNSHLNSEVTNIFPQPVSGILSWDILQQNECRLKGVLLPFKMCFNWSTMRCETELWICADTLSFYNANDRMNSDYILISLFLKTMHSILFTCED